MRAERYVTPEFIDAKTEEWLRHIRERVRPRPELVVKPEDCALVIIDMIRHFAAPSGRAYLPATQAVIPRIRALLDLWRSFGAPVIFTRHCHMDNGDLGMLGRFFTDHVRCSEEDSRLIDELSPMEGEPVIRKDTYDSFHSTELEEHLRSRGVKQVLVTGVLTQLCCETTARQAFVRGFEVHMAADAMATATEELHLGSLLGAASGFAAVWGAREILEMHGARHND